MQSLYECIVFISLLVVLHALSLVQLNKTPSITIRSYISDKKVKESIVGRMSSISLLIHALGLTEKKTSSNEFFRDVKIQTYYIICFNGIEKNKTVLFRVKT